MNIQSLKFIIILASLYCTACAVQTADLQNEGPVLEEWQSLPMPITQRYPALEVTPIDMNVAGQSNAINQADVEYFTCTDEEASTITDEVPLIDVSFIEADINDAILEISLLTGISIITDDNIEGLVSINFYGKSIDEVLAAIIAPGNYGFKKYDSFIFVGSQSPVSTSFHLLSSTCLYKPAFLQPEQIVELLTPYYQQYVNYYAGHDHLSIVAPETIQQRIQRDIVIFDQSPQQILLEMSIVEISTEALDLLGVKWNQEIDADKLFGQQNNERIYRYYDPRNSSSSVAQALIDSLSALSSREQAQIKATPSIVTLNGREANFSSIQTSWLPAFSNGNSNQRELNYGVELQIIPYISPGSHIRLEIKKASVSDLVEDADSMPKLISHAISTSVLMMDGETLILGGLLQKKNRQQAAVVPGASNIPLVGGMFRHDDREQVTTEVLIVIRPKILGGRGNDRI